MKSKIRSSRVAADVLFKAAFHGKSPFPSQAGKGLSTPYKEIGQQKSAVKADRTHLPVQSDFVRQEDTIYRDLEDEAERKILFRALNKLSGREKLIVRMRFGLDHPEGKEMTQKEVADQLGISQSYISRLEKKIMHRLRMEMVRYE